MSTNYEIHSGRRSLSLQNASTPREALTEYLRSLGCYDDEILTMGTDAVAWRGAVFSAVAHDHTGLTSRQAA